ncbi:MULTISPECIES: type VII toxin-antitoxin system MntA family adenylyltransferase antitoxin [Methylomicrobium]|uniref:Putative nucleotidyltransferase n=1 Tax=Methylomicrobium album BG8 TaxID=686340 RepID=H8GL09_METAL|nr:MULTISPECIES: nucleotidyltransferase domain-containing protein [Methylomicrobium]EIC30490.1 putative nucleotidyltransferase [Methylomicrobium album BG8]
MNTEPFSHAPDSNLESAVLSVLTGRKEMQLVILFGSLASGKARADSDLDLALDAGRPLDAETKMQLIGDLSAAIGRPVDLIDLRMVGEPLLGQILRHGKRLFGSNTCYADLIRKHLFEQADFLPYRNRILAERRKAWIGK